jgi:hypothetical protein
MGQPARRISKIRLGADRRGGAAETRTGASGDPGIHLAALERIIAEVGVQLLRVADLGGALGCSRPGQIRDLPSLTPADTVSVVVYELAHLCCGTDYVADQAAW